MIDTQRKALLMNRTTRRIIAAEQLVASTFATAEAEQRIEAARRNVDARDVAIEQWYIWFRAGKFSQARAFWFSEVQGAK
jgi:uncharacterized membrane protein